MMFLEESIISQAMSLHNVKRTKQWHYRAVMKTLIRILEEDFVVTRKLVRSPEEAKGRALIDAM